jgi:hypothetical protein
MKVTTYAAGRSVKRLTSSMYRHYTDVPADLDLHCSHLGQNNLMNLKVNSVAPDQTVLRSEKCRSRSDGMDVMAVLDIHCLLLIQK